jgi:hypothetical protein
MVWEVAREAGAGGELTMGRPQTFRHETAVQMYLDGLTLEQIGLLLDVPQTTINGMLIRRKVTRRDRGRRTYESWAEKLIAAEKATKQGVVK